MGVNSESHALGGGGISEKPVTMNFGPIKLNNPLIFITKEILPSNAKTTYDCWGPAPRPRAASPQE